MFDYIKNNIQPKNGIVLTGGILLLVITVIIIILIKSKENFKLSNNFNELNKEIMDEDMNNSLTNKAALSKELKNDILQTVINSDIYTIRTNNDFINIAFKQIAKRQPLRMESIYYNKLLNDGSISRTDVLIDIINKDSGIKTRQIQGLFHKYMGRKPSKNELDTYTKMMWTLRGPPTIPDYSFVTIEARISKKPETKFRTEVYNLFNKYRKRNPTKEEYQYFYGMWKNNRDPIKIEAIEQVLRNITPMYNHDYIEVSGIAPERTLIINQNPIKTVWLTKKGTLLTSRIAPKLRQGPTSRINQIVNHNEKGPYDF